MSVILLFGINEKKKKQIEKVATIINAKVCPVSLSDYNQKLGSLAGIIGFSRTKGTYIGPGFSMEMMVFSGINSKMLDVFLDEYKKENIENVKLKAVLTESNIGWTAEQLFREILKEHMQMKSRK